MLSIFFNHVSIRFLSPTSVEIRWDIEPPPYSPDEVGFQVHKSEVQGGSFTQLSPTLTDLMVYRDFYEGDTTSKWHKVYYKIRSFLLADPSNFVDSPVEHVHEDPLNDGNTPFADPVADIVRRNDFILEHPRYRVGKPCVVYQKRMTGQRCSCFDPVTQRVTVSKCPNCFGTGRFQGYHSGIDNIHVHFTAIPKQRMIQTWGDHDPGDTQAWMSNFPILKLEDIIVNTLTNEHWLVKRVKPSMHLIVSKQTVVVRKLNYDDIKRCLPFETKKYRI